MKLNSRFFQVLLLVTALSGLSTNALAEVTYCCSCPVKYIDGSNRPSEATLQFEVSGNVVGGIDYGTSVPNAIDRETRAVKSCEHYCSGYLPNLCEDFGGKNARNFRAKDGIKQTGDIIDIELGLDEREVFAFDSSKEAPGVFGDFFTNDPRVGFAKQHGAGNSYKRGKAALDNGCRTPATDNPCNALFDGTVPPDGAHQRSATTTAPPAGEPTLDELKGQVRSLLRTYAAEFVRTRVACDETRDTPESLLRVHMEDFNKGLDSRLKQDNFGGANIHHILAVTQEIAQLENKRTALRDAIRTQLDSQIRANSARDTAKQREAESTRLLREERAGLEQELTQLRQSLTDLALTQPQNAVIQSMMGSRLPLAETEFQVSAPAPLPADFQKLDAAEQNRLLKIQRTKLGEQIKLRKQQRIFADFANGLASSTKNPTDHHRPIVNWLQTQPESIKKRGTPYLHWYLCNLLINDANFRAQLRVKQSPAVSREKCQQLSNSLAEAAR